MHKPRSLLDELVELDSAYVKKDTAHVIESRAQHVIASAINLLAFISESYTADESAELERKFINAIRHKDERKFVRSLRKK